jgi:hypothetical protein
LPCGGVSAEEYEHDAIAVRSHSSRPIADLSPVGWIAPHSSEPRFRQAVVLRQEIGGRCGAPRRSTTATWV